MIVLDSSAAVDLLLGNRASAKIAERLCGVGQTSVPELFDLEVTHALRGLVIAGKLKTERAEEALADLGQLPLNRYPHFPLLKRCWQLRSNCTIYDAVYIALAEILDASLITADRKLAGVPSITTSLELMD